MASGDYTLVAKQITVALTAEAQTAIDGLDGLHAVLLTAVFSYGAGGTTLIAVVQMSDDGGTNWRDIARFDFSTSSIVKWCNLSALTPKGITTYATLSSEGVTDGLLAGRLRAVITSTGVYSGTTITVRASVK